MLHTGIKNGLYYMCTLYPYIEQVGHGRGHLGGKDDSCNSTLAIYMKYLSMGSRNGGGEEIMQLGNSLTYCSVTRH